MYYPFIRGLQYDILALREIDKNLYTRGLILPIIEPVKIEGNALAGYKDLVRKNIPFILVSNPIHGGNEPRAVRNALINDVLDGYDNYHIAYLIKQNTTANNVQRFLDRYADWQVCLIHYRTPTDIYGVAGVVSTATNVSHNILEDDLSTEYFDALDTRGTVNVLLRDGFNKRRRNEDYADALEEFFCDNFRKYRRMNYEGFGDYCTIGDNFAKGGGKPRAVTLHLTYRAPDGKSITVQHFISDDIDNDGNAPGKYLQALGKLTTFIDSYAPFIHTAGSGLFQSQTKFNGLGIGKKISIMHHIELMSQV